MRRSDMIRAQGVKGTVDLQGRGNDVELENVQGQVTIDGPGEESCIFANRRSLSASKACKPNCRSSA